MHPHLASIIYGLTVAKLSGQTVLTEGGGGSFILEVTIHAAERLVRAKPTRAVDVEHKSKLVTAPAAASRDGHGLDSIGVAASDHRQRHGPPRIDAESYNDPVLVGSVLCKATAAFAQPTVAAASRAHMQLFPRRNGLVPASVLVSSPQGLLSKGVLVCSTNEPPCLLR